MKKIQIYFLHGFWAVFEARDELNPLSEKNACFPKNEKSSAFYEIPFIFADTLF